VCGMQMRWRLWQRGRRLRRMIFSCLLDVNLTFNVNRSIGKDGAGWCARCVGLKIYLCD